MLKWRSTCIIRRVGDRQDAVVVPWTWHDGPAISREYQSVPIESGSVDVVYASHFLGHIPAGQPHLDVFNEAWRVLRPSGVFEFLVPLPGWTERHPGAKGRAHPLEARWTGTHRLVADPRTYADPTHVSAWWFPQSLLYFTGSEKQMSRHSPTTASRRFCLLTVVHAGRSRMVGLDTLG